MKFALSAGRDAAVTLPAIAIAALFVCLIVYQAYSFWEDQQALRTPLAGVAKPAQTAHQNAPDIGKLAAKHLFGDVENQAPQYSEVKEDKTLNLTLRGIVAAEGSSTSHAIIQSGPNNEETFALGDNVFSKGKLDFIASDHVILARSNGQLARLQLPEEESSGLSSEEYLPPATSYIEPDNSYVEPEMPHIEQTVDNFQETEPASEPVPLPAALQQPDFQPELQTEPEVIMETEILEEPAEPINEEQGYIPDDEHPPE